jgi:general secretion pathway protein A
MYTSHFKLRENPFSLTPDPKYLFLSRQHREALNHLIYGIKEKKGFIVITGGIGTGKTTLSRALVAGMDPYVETALIFNSYLSDMELLEVINQEFKVSLVGVDRTKRRYIDSLNAFLMANYQAGKNAVVLIDEAQNLSRNVLEQIRMLSNLETETEKLLQIVLVGQPELRDLLAQPSLKQLTERISVRYHLDALSRDDVPDYIGHRLAVSGDTGHLKFADDAFGKIYDYSRGNPRRINILCDRAMLIAYAGNLLEIDRKVIKLAVKDLKSSDVKKGTLFARTRKGLFAQR